MPIVIRAGWMSLLYFPGALAVFMFGHLTLFLPAVYVVAVLAGGMDRYILMLHCVSHRRLFRKRYGALNLFIPCLLGPIFGQTPFSYYVHHVGMHHREDNALTDLSTTEPYDRARFTHWLAYVWKFLVFTPITLPAYLYRTRRGKMLAMLAAGELCYWAVVVMLMVWVSLSATLFVFVIPLAFARIAMMAGNWAQHAFIDANHRDDPFRYSITCINTSYNRRCFNDGYHIVHHIRPGLHYSEMAAEFEATKTKYRDHEAVVFDGIDFFQVWWLLMTRQWQKLAKAFVVLPGAPDRTHAEIVTLLQSRTEPLVSDG